MKNYFISYVLQEPGEQDIFGNSIVTMVTKINKNNKDELQSKLQDTIRNAYELKNKHLIILNIVKL